MKTGKGLSISRVVHPRAVPEGRYCGKWGAYQVTVEIEGITHHIKTDVGIRTLSADCCVVVANGEISIEMDC